MSSIKSTEKNLFSALMLFSLTNLYIHFILFYKNIRFKQKCTNNLQNVLKYEIQCMWFIPKNVQLWDEIASGFCERKWIFCCKYTGCSSSNADLLIRETSYLVLHYSFFFYSFRTSKELKYCFPFTDIINVCSINISN